MATAYQKRMLLRKNSDLTRLAEQYKKNIEASTSEYESAFAKYQQERDAAMAPYEAAVKQYKDVQMPAYEAAAAAYQQRLDAFNQKLSAYESDTGGQELVMPGDKNVRFTQKGNASTAYATINNRDYFMHELPEGYSAKRITQPSGRITFELYKPKERGPVPTFSEKAPSAPQAPTAPQIAGFDETQFQQKREQLQTDFQRETGERKGARLGAVGRRGSRPLMQEK